MRAMMGKNDICTVICTDKTNSGYGLYMLITVEGDYEFYDFAHTTEFTLKVKKGLKVSVSTVRMSGAKMDVSLDGKQVLYHGYDYYFYVSQKIHNLSIDYFND